MDPDLAAIKTITGISRNQLAEIFGYPPSSIARWEQGKAAMTPFAQGILAELARDFTEATEWLDGEGLTWDQVVHLRTVAMKLGESPATLGDRLLLHGIFPIDFGLLGQYITTQELVACRR